MELFSQRMGTGPPLIILHGLFGLSDNWISFGRSLADRWEVIIPDLRNHGRSPWSPLFDFPSLETDILELIDSLEDEAVTILGHSLGGRVAAHLALRYPSRVKALVVVDISLRKYPPRREHLELIHAMQSVDLRQLASRSQAEQLLEQQVPSERIRRFLLKNLYWMQRGSLAWRLNLSVLSEQLPALFDAQPVPGIYPGPALFIRGGASDYITAADVVTIKAQFPGSAVRTIEGASHWVHADRPGEFYALVEAFLSGSVPGDFKA